MKFSMQKQSAKFVSRWVLALCVWTAPVIANSSATPLEISVTAQVLKTSASVPAQKEWRPATLVKEGEPLFYTVHIRNAGLQPITNAVVTRALPQNTEYVPESASAPGAAIFFSADGGRTFARPEQLTVSGKSGRLHRATAAEYTHIQWRLLYPLAPGAIALARFSVVFAKS
jgi:uncharacterized repeat protein (TIGR01451 family)